MATSERLESYEFDAVDSQKAPKMSYQMVIFRGVEDSYAAGTDIECRYTVSQGLEIGSRDWVGLFKVGWRSQSDFFCYQWAPEPKPVAGRADLTGAIKFLATTLPHDDGEFYQFCYVSAVGQVRGASTPFQFKAAELEDFITVEEENGELLVIRTKTTVLEDQLKKANETRSQLKQEIQILENEKELLKRSEAELQKKLQAQHDINSMAGSKIKELQEHVTDVTNQNEHLQGRIDSMQERIDVINQEKLSMEKRLDDSDRYIGSLQEKIKALVNEKDSLTGRVKSLEEEKELYKGHFTTSEDTLQSYVQECERVKMALLEEQASKQRVKKEMDRIDAELAEQRRINESMVKSSQAEKENLSYLTERMRNAEDKLSAAEHCKMMLNEEVLNLKVEYEKTLQDLETARLELDRMAGVQSSAINSLSSHMAELSSQLLCKEKEARELAEEVERSRGELKQEQELRQKSEEKVARNGGSEEAAGNDGALYALQFAQQTLKERLAKMTRRNDELQRSLEQATTRMTELMESDDDQRREISSLRSRLLMGQEAYKEKYIEWEKLENELYRLKICKNSSIAASRESISCSSSGTAEEAAGAAEGRQMLAKARRYKQLYTDQKQMSEQLLQQLQQKEQEIERLRKLIVSSYPPAEYATVPKPKVNTNTRSAPAQMSILEVDGEEEVGLDAGDVVGPLRLAPPLKPLPAPIIPERLHAPFRLSAIREHDNTDIGLNVVSAMMTEEFITDNSPHGTTSPSAPPAEQLNTAAATTAAASTAAASATSIAAASVFTSTSTAVSITVSNGTTSTTAASTATAATATATTAAFDNGQQEDERFEDARGDMDVIVQCPCCEFTFTFQHQEEAVTFLDRHFNEAHMLPDAASTASVTICPICNERFPQGTSEDEISSHMDRHFPDTR